LSGFVAPRENNSFTTPLTPIARSDTEWCFTIIFCLVEVEIAQCEGQPYHHLMPRFRSGREWGFTAVVQLGRVDIIPCE